MLLIILFVQSNNARVKEFRSFGKALVQVGFAAREEKPIFVKIGMCFDEISNLWESQSSKDWEPFHRILYEYKVENYPLFLHSTFYIYLSSLHIFRLWFQIGIIV